MKVKKKRQLWVGGTGKGGSNGKGEGRGLREGPWGWVVKTKDLLKSYETKLNWNYQITDISP